MDPGGYSGGGYSGGGYNGGASPSGLLRAAASAGVSLEACLDGTGDWYNVAPPVRAAVASLLDAHAAQTAEVAALRRDVAPLLEALRGLPQGTEGLRSALLGAGGAGHDVRRDVAAALAEASRARATADAAAATAEGHAALLERHAQQMVRLSGSVGAVDAHAANLSAVALQVQALASPPATPDGAGARLAVHANGSAQQTAGTPIGKVKQMIAEHMVRATHAADLAIEPLARRVGALERAIAAGATSSSAQASAVPSRAAQEAAARAAASAEKAHAAVAAAVALSPPRSALAAAGGAQGSLLDKRLSELEAQMALLRTQLAEASSARPTTGAVRAMLEAHAGSPAAKLTGAYGASGSAGAGDGGPAAEAAAREARNARTAVDALSVRLKRAEETISERPTATEVSAVIVEHMRGKRVEISGGMLGGGGGGVGGGVGGAAAGRSGEVDRRLAAVELSTLRRDERENGRFQQLLSQFESFMHDKVSRSEFELEMTMLNAKLEGKLDVEVFRRHAAGLGGRFTPPLSPEQSPIKLPMSGEADADADVDAVAPPATSPAHHRLDGRRPSSRDLHSSPIRLRGIGGLRAHTPSPPRSPQGWLG